jgi:hypothetical protein
VPGGPAERRRLDASQRSALNLVEVDGQLYNNHWYVLIAARRP